MTVGRVPEPLEEGRLFLLDVNTDAGLSALAVEHHTSMNSMGTWCLYRQPPTESADRVFFVYRHRDCS